MACKKLELEEWENHISKKNFETLGVTALIINDV